MYCLRSRVKMLVIVATVRANENDDNNDNDDDDDNDDEDEETRDSPEPQRAELLGRDTGGTCWRRSGEEEGRQTERGIKTTLWVSPFKFLARRYILIHTNFRATRLALWTFGCIDRP